MRNRTLRLSFQWFCVISRSGQHGGPDDARFGTENSQLDLRKRLVVKEHITGELPDERLQQERTCLADASAENDDLRVNQIDNAGDGLREIADKPMIAVISEGLFPASFISIESGCSFAASRAMRMIAVAEQ